MAGPRPLRHHRTALLGPGRRRHPAPWGDLTTPGENLRTQWETTLAAQYTSDINEYAYTAALDAAATGSGCRDRQDRLGRPSTCRHRLPQAAGDPGGRRRHLAAAVNCNVHGNEPGDREACLIMARNSPSAPTPASRTCSVAHHRAHRAHHQRRRPGGQHPGQLDRAGPEPGLLADPPAGDRRVRQMVRDYHPVASYDGHEFGNANAGDLPMLPPRHQNVAKSIFDESQHMIEGHMYTKGAKDGWWPCPYGCAGGGAVGLSEETILRNTAGLKNVVNSLLRAAQLRRHHPPGRGQHGEQPAA